MVGRVRATQLIRPALREGLGSSAELAALMRSPVWLGRGMPSGNGRPVMLIAGYWMPDASLEALGRWLRLRGYRTYRAGIPVNIGCSERLCERLERRLEAIAAKHGPVAIVGHSRGGILAKALAATRPDLVSGIVTLGSPTRPPSRPGRSPREVREMLRTGHLQNLMSSRCRRDECGSRFAERLVGPFPDDVGFVAIYSRADAVVPFHSCLDDAARQVEVRGSHLGMPHNPAVLRKVGAALGELAGETRDASALDRLRAVGRALKVT